MAAFRKHSQSKAKGSQRTLGKSGAMCGPLLRKGLILGQAPPGPRKTLPKGWKPLDGPVGDRLARLAGLSGGSKELWKAFDRRNVIEFFPGEKMKLQQHKTTSGYKLHMSTGDLFPMEKARKEAAKIPMHRRPIVVLCGLNVARAFQLRIDLLETQRLSSGTIVLNLPHPSGVSHFWNEPSNVHKAARVFRNAVRKSGLLSSSRMKGSPIVGCIKKQPLKKGKADTSRCKLGTVKKQLVKKQRSPSGKRVATHATQGRRSD